MYTIRYILVFMFAVLIGLTASCSNQIAQPAYKIHILDWTKESSISNLGYKRDQSWTVLKTIDLEKSIFVISDFDIVSYEWSDQVIILNNTASVSLENAISDKGLFSLDHHAFVVTLDDERLYGGLFLQAGSPIGIDYPAIYVETSETGNIAFRIRPYHPIWSFYETPNDERYNEIQIPDVYDLFYKQGKLCCENKVPLFPVKP